MTDKLLNSLGKLMVALAHSQKIVPERAAEAYLHYAKELKGNYTYSTSYKKWDVCWIQWGNNLEPEISYKHFGIIFKTDNRHVYAIPITSFKQDNPKHISAYHPTTNPTGDKTYIRINSSEFPFLQHDSVVKAEEMKLISTKRIISVCGSISSNTELKEVLSSYLFDYLFPDKADMLDRNQRENSLLKMKLFLSEAEREYSIKSPEDLRTLLNIPADYNYQLIDTEPEKTEDKPHMSTFILRDVYQQTISKALLIKYKA